MRLTGIWFLGMNPSFLELASVNQNPPNDWWVTGRGTGTPGVGSLSLLFYYFFPGFWSQTNSSYLWNSTTIKTRWSWDSFIFIMGISICVKQHLCIEMAPRVLSFHKDHLSMSWDHLILIMTIHILIRSHPYTETAKPITVIFRKDFRLTK